MLIEILSNYRKTPPFRGTLWQMELKMAQSLHGCLVSMVTGCILYEVLL